MAAEEYRELRDLIDGLGREMRHSFAEAAKQREDLSKTLTKVLFIGGNGGGPYGIYHRLDDLERRQETRYVQEAKDRQRDDEASRDIKKILVALGIEVAKTGLAIATALVVGKGVGWL